CLEFRDSFEVTLMRPAGIRRASALHLLGRYPIAVKADRFLSRQWDYPRLLKHHLGDFDVFHIIDHSYAHLVNYLPGERTIVTCHDLDAFKSILEPEVEPRGLMFRAMTRRILSGLQRAAMVVCVSESTRNELLANRLVAPHRIIVIPNGVAPEFSPVPDPPTEAELTRLIGSPPSETVELLHVGAAMPRKRIDDLIEIFARIRAVLPRSRLLRAGGKFTEAQMRMIQSLGLNAAVVNLPFLTREVLASLYRRAGLLLLPSEAEGFGLPMIEALGWGTAMSADDLPVLRGGGGDGAQYCPVGDIGSWSQAAVRLLAEQTTHPDLWQLRRTSASDRSRMFSWSQSVRRIAEVYRGLDAFQS